MIKTTDVVGEQERSVVPADRAEVEVTSRRRARAPTDAIDAPHHATAIQRSESSHRTLSHLLQIFSLKISFLFARQGNVHARLRPLGMPKRDQATEGIEPTRTEVRNPFRHPCSRVVLLSFETATMQGRT